MGNQQSSVLNNGGFFMAKRKLTIEQEKQILKLYNEGYLVNDLKLLYGFKTNKSILDIVKKKWWKNKNFSRNIKY